jgi:hypothetical protein
VSISIPFARCLLCGLVLASAACTQTEGAPPITDEQFVRVMVELRRAADAHAGDAAAFDLAREEILSEAAVTDSMLHQYVNVRARDLERLGRVFDEIRDSLRQMPDSVPR